MSKFLCGNFCAEVMQTHSFQTVHSMQLFISLCAIPCLFFLQVFWDKLSFLNTFRKLCSALCIILCNIQFDAEHSAMQKCVDMLYPKSNSNAGMH